MNRIGVTQWRNLKLLWPTHYHSQLYRSRVGKSEKLPNTGSCIFEMVSLICLDKYKHLKYQLLGTRMWGKDVGCRHP